MPVPTVYTEQSLAAFMMAVLDRTAKTVGWFYTDLNDLPGKYQEAINETLISYGVDDISQAIDMRKLRALARREVWRSVSDAVVNYYRFGSDREVYFRQQVWEHASMQFTRASTDASIYEFEDARFNVGFAHINDRRDPYQLPEAVEVVE